MPLSPTFFQSHSRILIHLAAIIALLCGLVVVGLFVRYHHRMLPNIYIDDQLVGGYTALETRELLIAHAGQVAEHKFTIVVDDIAVASSSSELGLSRMIDQELEKAFAIGRQGSLLHRVNAFVTALFKKQSFTTRLAYQKQPLTDLITKLATQVDYPGIEPQATLKYSGSVRSLKIDPGSFGRKVNQAATREAAVRAANQGTFEITAVVASTSGELSEFEALAAQERAAKFVGKKITLKNEDQSVTLRDQKLVQLLAFPT
ncbi:MAG: hypothetical protein COU68_00275, partial [Candidatus Pacebacteria bacterium CG10_big_fil_rev_8_21_14_0_10_45_6]